MASARGGRGLTHEAPGTGATTSWYTPRWLFESLGLVFDLDPCHPGRDVYDGVPAHQVLTEEDDGLVMPWASDALVWCNPPYGDPENACVPGCKKKRCITRGHLLKDDPGMEPWLVKMSEHANGVALVFARSDAGWFHGPAVTADAMLLMEGRVRFVQQDGQPGGSPGSGSMLLAWGDRSVAAVRRFQTMHSGLLIPASALAGGFWP